MQRPCWAAELATTPKLFVPEEFYDYASEFVLLVYEILGLNGNRLIRLPRIYKMRGQNNDQLGTYYWDNNWFELRNNRQALEDIVDYLRDMPEDHVSF